MPVIVGLPSPTREEEFSPDLPTRAYLGDSGIVFGDGSEADEHGVVWKWAPTNAWGPKPAPREQITDRALAHGQADGTRFYGPRVLQIPGTARATSHAALHAAEQRLRDAVSIRGFTLRITEPGWDGYATVRQQGEVLWTENTQRPGYAHASWSIALYAADPYIYSSLLRAFEIAFPSRSGGLEWPATWPATWDAVSTSGMVTLFNPGTEPAPLLLKAFGAVADFEIANPETGQALRVVNPDGPTLAAGEWMQLDTGRRQALLMGTGSRRSWVTGDWLLLPPGESTLAIGSSSASTDARVSGEYRGTRI